MDPLKAKAAATDAALADVLDWLATRPAMQAHIEAIGDTTRQLRQTIPAPDRKPVMKAMADHLWCSALTALACTLGTVADNDIPEAVTPKVAAARSRDHRAPLDDDIVRLAITTAWSQLRRLPVFQDAEGGRRVCRIMVTLMCPALHRHPGAVNHCIVPLAEEDIVSPVTMRRLKISGVLS